MDAEEPRSHADARSNLEAYVSSHTWMASSPCDHPAQEGHVHMCQCLPCRVLHSSDYCVVTGHLSAVGSFHAASWSPTLSVLPSLSCSPNCWVWIWVCLHWLCCHGASRCGYTGKRVRAGDTGGASHPIRVSFRVQGEKILGSAGYCTGLGEPRYSGFGAWVRGVACFRRRLPTPWGFHKVLGKAG